MSKRRKFIGSSLLLSLGLLAIQYVALEYRFIAVFAFMVVSYLVSSLALLDDLKGVEWITIVPLPAIYAGSVALFYFLLPSGFGARVFILSLFGLGMYAIYLTANIFSVAAVRTIQLLRAAHAVGFLLTLVTILLFFNTIFSLKLFFWWNGILSGIAAFPMILSSLWSIKLENTIDKAVWWKAGLLALIICQLGMALSFLPMTVWVASMILVTAVYVGLGLFQHELSDRLFEQSLVEYTTIGVFVLAASLLVTNWK